MRILVTGSAGFIGSHVAEKLHNDKFNVVVADKLAEYPNEQYHLEKDCFGIMERIDIVVHMAAETFVDKSIKSPEPFINNNIIATYNLLEDARRYDVKKFIYVSTDEVYGSIENGMFDENAPLNPGNPYSATKACGEMLCKAWAKTYGIPVIIVRPENNYGFGQHPQKAIPTWVNHCLQNRPLPLYGDGKHKRMWLRVEDMTEAIKYIITKGKIGETYNIGGYQEHENIDVVNRICKILEVPVNINYIPDEKIRPGHDRRYGIDCEKIRSLGWAPKFNLDNGLKDVVMWYKANESWLA